MSKVRNFLINSAGLLDLPPDVMTGIPRMELVGFQSFSIESHKGLLEYEKDQISIETRIGQLRLTGSDLTIKLMNSNRISINGSISSLVLLGMEL